MKKPNKPHTTNSPSAKRPLVISIFCIMGLVVPVFQFITSFIPQVMDGLVKQFPIWYVILILVFLYPASVASVVGIWGMRRWGVYLYGAVFLISCFIMFFFFGYYPKLPAVLLSGGFLGVSLIYFKRMQ